MTPDGWLAGRSINTNDLAALLLQPTCARINGRRSQRHPARKRRGEAMMGASNQLWDPRCILSVIGLTGFAVTRQRRTLRLSSLLAARQL